MGSALSRPTAKMYPLVLPRGAAAGRRGAQIGDAPRLCAAQAIYHSTLFPVCSCWRDSGQLGVPGVAGIPVPVEIRLSACGVVLGCTSEEYLLWNRLADRRRRARGRSKVSCLVLVGKPDWIDNVRAIIYRPHRSWAWDWPYMTTPS